MAKWKKNQFIKKMKRKFILGIGIALFLITTFAFLLNQYLFFIQKEERLSKKTDFKDFSISYLKQNRCEKIPRIEKNDVVYYFDCLDMVYVSFGETKISFEEAIERGYLTLPNLLDSTTFKNKEEESSVYEKRKTGTYPYQIVVLEKDAQIEVTLRSI